jgi:hypothetical protein
MSYNEPTQPALPFPGAGDGIELRHLRAFVAVAEELSFARAADRLYVSSPALSRQIRGLEQLIGTELLRRFTPSGRSGPRSRCRRQAQAVPDRGARVPPVLVVPPRGGGRHRRSRRIHPRRVVPSATLPRTTIRSRHPEFVALRSGRRMTSWPRRFHASSRSGESRRRNLGVGSVHIQPVA